MIQVSIVTGTYNRLPYLKKMVESTRCSVEPLSYEIILVDGGSTDGTIKWCKRQPDIRLIEQGQLLGAVKAFNAGAVAARGEYVVLGNDDVEFVGKSILCAWSFMEDDEGVGIGCFYQDRGGKSWHVEVMPAVGPGEVQISVPYGQVCIVPKWLGDEVGWWGTYLRTYGGDNELSCNVLELGYEVIPVEGAYIHDMRADDELRIINEGDPRELGKKGVMHPDSKLWYRKWSYRGKIGARLATTRKIINPLRTSRSRKILYAPIYEPGHALQRKTKSGLRRALQDVGVVVECDYVDDGIKELRSIACNLCPDIFILQIQDANTFNASTIRAMKEDHPNAKFVSWNGDYHPDNLYDSKYVEMMTEFDVAGHAVAGVIKDLYKSKGINWFYWQIGYEESDAEPNQATECHDVVFLGNGYSSSRKTLGQFLNGLRGMARLNIGLYGDWSTDIRSNGSTLYDFAAGRKTYRASKLAISDQQWPDAEGYVSNRLFQAMAAGRCMVLQQYFDGMEDYLGLRDYEHLRVWRDFDHLERLLQHYTDPDHDDERMRISMAGHKYMLENHSFDVRVKELLSELQDE